MVLGTINVMPKSDTVICKEEDKIKDSYYELWNRKEACHGDVL